MMERDHLLQGEEVDLVEGEGGPELHQAMVLQLANMRMEAMEGAAGVAGAEVEVVASVGVGEEGTMALKWMTSMMLEAIIKDHHVVMGVAGGLVEGVVDSDQMGRSKPPLECQRPWLSQTRDYMCEFDVHVQQRRSFSVCPPVMLVSLA